jgi:hypothetical protein
MKPTGHATAEHFQQEVVDLLELPPGSGDVEVRKALIAKGPDFLAWYDSRLQAIAESNRLDDYLQRTHRMARRADQHH